MSRREFHFTEGSSSKFWAITVDGKAFTVEFGRLGSKGQTQSKEFASVAAAQQAAEKLIAEKTRKGYQEVGNAASVVPASASSSGKRKGKTSVAETPDTAPTTPEAPPVPALRVERVIALDPVDWLRATWRPRQRLEGTVSLPDGKPAKKLSRLTKRDVQAKDVLTALDDKSLYDFWLSSSTDAITWAAYHLFPYLSDDVLADLRHELRSQVDPRKWPTDTEQWPPIAFFLAALAGLHDEVRSVVESWPDDLYRPEKWNRTKHMPLHLVFGLGDPQLVDRHTRRLRLPFDELEDYRAWLAHTEFAGLDYVREQIQSQTDKEDALESMKVFCLVNAPEAAPHMLELKLNSRAQGAARQWLDAHPGNAIAGLIPTAAGRGKLAEAALDYLRQAQQRGHGAFIEEQLRAAPPEIAKRIRQEVLEQAKDAREPLDEANTPAWLRTALKDSDKVSGFPSWVSLASLPPLVFGNQRLNDHQVSAVLSTLRQSPLGTPLPLVQAIKEHIDPAAGDAFAWKLFDLWLSEGAPSKEKWALLAIGHLGGDNCALKLTPYLRAWPGESQHQRAVTGLECLRAIGSDTALMQLNGIAQKLKFQGLKKKAQEFMEAIAQDRGMSRTQLEDRIVPDLDLDERGTRVFDFGSRQFTVVLDADLKPVIRDEAGKLKSDLPKPGAKDDADKANAALADWKLLKKQLREAIKVQAYRLEQAMVTGRRWSIAEFEKLLVHHPLMLNLVRRLVWAGYDNKGKLVRTFRVTEERDYADERDEHCTLDGVADVAIIHPLHLSEDNRSAWGQVFGDYEIFAPFPQLGRPVLGLAQEEKKATEIKRFSAVRIPAPAVMGTMEKLGWTRGSGDDHGVIQEFIKQFPAADVTAVLENEPGVSLGMMEHSGDQKIERCLFLRGMYKPVSYPRHTKLIPLKSIDPVVISEVLADLTTLASKGK